MTLAIRVPRVGNVAEACRDYLGYVRPFLRRVERRRLWPAMLALKSIEWAVYRWYEPAVSRSYGPLAPEVRELLYMITRRCTDACEKCGIWRSPEAAAERVPVDRVHDAIRALGGRLRGFTITGGEPLLHRDEVLALGQTCHSTGTPMTVVTNGVLADGSFLRRFALTGHALVFSIDTMDRSKWPHFRGRDNADVVVANLESAVALLGPRVTVQSVLAKETVADVEEVKRYCTQVCVEHRIQPWADFGGGWHVHSENASTSSGSCEAWRNLCIHPNGDVTRCFDHHRVPASRAPLGNLKVQSIESILQAPSTHAVTEAIRACGLPCRQLSCNSAGVP